MARAIPSSDLTRSSFQLSATYHVAHPGVNTPADDTCKTLSRSLVILLAQVQALQQQALAMEEQTRCITRIRQLYAEIAPLINKLTPTDPNFSRSTNNLLVLQQQLQGVRTLVVDDHKEQGNALLKQLQSFGLASTYATPEQALAALRLAEQQHTPYQIVIISAQNFDHHVAYLARTIKASMLFSPIMLSLALTTDLPDFEKERAYFDGFACVLNPTEPVSLLQKLINSWRGWATKINFTRNEVPLAQSCILLVEDDPIPQKVTQRQLMALGYKVDIAADGHTALKLMEQKLYDLVFMDIGLPDISGLEVTSEFRKREKGVHHTPIIGLTVYALPSDQESGLQAGMDEYLIKPLLPAQLKNVLKSWVSDKEPL